MGVIATSVALNLAKEANLDLVEVAPNAKPPVAKLIDYGKYKYNEKIKAREARRNQSTAEIKEIRFRLKIDDHDFDVKKGHVVRFLNGGDKVKVTIMLRGREQSPTDRAASSCCSDLPAKWRNTALSNSPEAGRPQHHHDARAEGQEGPYPVRAASSWRSVPCRAPGSSGGSSGGQAGGPGSGRSRSQGSRGIRQTEDFRNEVTNKEGSNAEDEN